jgi:paraquat-inducible protein B
LPKAVIKKRPRFSIIWFIPLIAVGIGLWLVYQTVVESGVPITITFKNGEGLVNKKTFIYYKGVQVGDVDEVTLSTDLKTVVVQATLHKSAVDLATEGASFWIVRPKLGPAGITGLDTLMSGVYIAVSPGTGAPVRAFRGLEDPQLGNKTAPGMNIVLTSDNLGSIEAGSPVYYRQVQVGEVEEYKLAPDSKSVEINVHIDEDYQPLIWTGTKFWNASGIKMTTNLLGAKIEAESLEAILAGGIALATPEGKSMGEKAKDGAVFRLYSDAKSRWFKWQPKIILKKTKVPTAEEILEQTERKSSVLGSIKKFLSF